MFDSDASPRFLAAIDLGSNSFHMVIAQEDEEGSTRIIDTVKEMVRLNAGLDEHGMLSVEAQERALECLHRFRQRLKDIPPDRLRVVGTNTLRAAHNSRDFLDLAESALGHNISVISGHEEARLVYHGAAFSLAATDRQRLVVDIGGGSTELIIGRGYRPFQMDSLYMGCVSMSRRVFADGTITAERLERARAIAQQELEPVIATYRQIGWSEVVGTSGTVRAIDELSRSLGMNQDWISSKSLKKIKKWLIKKGNISEIDLVPAQRQPVFCGGFAILEGVFEALSIERMDAADGALREGVLYDLNGRLHDEDSREMGVAAMLAQFQPDTAQSDRVEQTATGLLEKVAGAWDLLHPLDRKLLTWASRLHEIGIAIAYNQYHKHGAYIIENSNMDGFSRQQQRLLAMLVRSHRQKFPDYLLEDLPAEWRSRLRYLAVLLRLSVALNRSRSDEALPEIRLGAGEHDVTMSLPRSWCDAHPLTMMDLDTERVYLEQVDFALSLECIEPDQ